MKKAAVLLCITILLIHGQTARAADDNMETVNAEILKVTGQQAEGATEYQLEVVVLGGTHKDETFVLQFSPLKYSQWDFIPKVGQSLVLRINNGEQIDNISIIGLSRQKNLSLLFLIFFISLFLFGGKRGILSLTALILSGVIIYVFYIPLVLQGYNVIVLTVITTTIIVIISFVIIAGFTKKSLSSILGTVCGIIIAVILAEIFCRICGITGTQSDEAYILSCDNGLELDYPRLFVGGIIIGTIGVVTDVSMSITSLIFELKSNSPNMGFMKLVRSGLNVGKDMTATMINTLVLAYVGTSMLLMFVFSVTAPSFTYAINMESVSGEIIRSLCGSIGLIYTVPFTSVIASYIIINSKTRSDRRRSSSYASRHRNG